MSQPGPKNDLLILTVCMVVVLGVGIGAFVLMATQSSSHGPVSEQKGALPENGKKELSFQDKKKQSLMQTNGCMACHKMDEKLIGPSLKDIAKKYQPSDLDSLVEKVLKGGVGVWGDMMMPPQGHVPEDKIRDMVEWILSLKDSQE